MSGVANVRDASALRRKRPTLSREACLHGKRFLRLRCSESGPIGRQARSRPGRRLSFTWRELPMARIRTLLRDRRVVSNTSA